MKVKTVGHVVSAALIDEKSDEYLGDIVAYPVEWDGKELSALLVFDIEGAIFLFRADTLKWQEVNEGSQIEVKWLFPNWRKAWLEGENHKKPME